MCKKHNKVRRVLNFIKHLLISVSAVTGCVSIFAFASFICMPLGNPSTAIALKIMLLYCLKCRKNTKSKKPKRCTD